MLKIRKIRKELLFVLLITVKIVVNFGEQLVNTSRKSFSPHFHGDHFLRK